ncbi:FAD-dependent oxidoreductase [Candidatus Latescibacterota bacterium]
MTRRLSCFEQVHDVVVVGAGYAGFAAAVALADAGCDVLLTCHDGATVWESGRAFASRAGEDGSQLWQEWVGELANRGAMATGLVDGACAEIVASRWLVARKKNLKPLYYARPVAAEITSAGLCAVAMATKSGVRRLCARRWVDATETGELLRLLLPELPAGRPPASRALHLLFQEAGFATAPDLDISWQDGDISVSLQPTVWPNQRQLTLQLGEQVVDARPRIPDQVSRLRELLPENLDKAVMTHCSGTAVTAYRGCAPGVVVPANVVNAAAQYVSQDLLLLADRFALGLAAARAAEALGGVEPTVAGSVPPVRFIAGQQTDLVVAGAGTGGAIAAVAAADLGARVICVDLMPFAGGLGSGGGINGYCLGAEGGLFEQIDQRSGELCALFAAGRRAGGWHHEAKKMALAERFADTGAEFLGDTLVFDVERVGRRLVAIHASTPAGPVRIEAQAFIDGSGDADLCRRAGAACENGRPGDGAVLSFSQVAGQLLAESGTIGMSSVNYDAGHVDPTDPEDISRGRLQGTVQFLRESYGALSRFCYMAPVIGLRQSVHVCSDQDITVADLILHRRFPDSIGPTFSFLDTHAMDFEFDEDDVGFWLWVCRNFRGRVGCDLPYGMLLPRNLDNVWVACRAAGMSTAAAYALRMERDIQRLGEAAGTAAAMAVTLGDGSSRSIDIARLQARLRSTGSLYDDELFEPATVAQGLAAIRNGEPCGALWQVYAAREQAETEVAALLLDESVETSWLAACILAMWGDGRAEDRLIQAVANREQGPEPTEAAVGAFGQRIVIPNWLNAVVLLRCCGTARCLPTLASLTSEPGLVLNVRTALALTLERLVSRCGDDLGPDALRIADRLLADDPPDRICKPSRSIDLLLRGEAQLKMRNDIGSDVREDHGWQLHVVVARIRRALGAPAADLSEPWLTHECASVRKPFTSLLE